MPAKKKYNTHVLIKYEDITKYLERDLAAVLLIAIKQIDNSRLEEGRPTGFVAVRSDEPYFEEVHELILEREGSKNENTN